MLIVRHDVWNVKMLPGKPSRYTCITITPGWTEPFIFYPSGVGKSSTAGTALRPVWLGQCFSTFLLPRNPEQAWRSLTEPHALIRASSDVREVEATGCLRWGYGLACSPVSCCRYCTFSCRVFQTRRPVTVKTRLLTVNLKAWQVTPVDVLFKGIGEMGNADW